MIAIHHDFLELAAAGIDFELTAAERASLDAHLATCHACRRRIAGLRSDDYAIAALPRFGLSPAAAERLRPANRRHSRHALPALRLVAVAALLALLAMAAFTIGAEFLRRERDRDLVVVPPPTVIVDEPSAPPSALPSASPSASPIVPPSAPPLVGAAWRSLGESEPMRNQEVEGLAPNGSSGMIAGGCVQPSYGAGCTDAAVWLSANGGRWSQPVLLPGLEGEIAGPVRVFGSSEDQLIAAGVVDRNDVRVAVFWASVDGTAWTRAPDDASFESAEVHQVERVGRRWVAIGSGSFGEPAGFRAWTSEDGLAWVPATGPVVDGSYPTRFVAVDEGLLAVGPKSAVSVAGSRWWASTDGGLTWDATPEPSGLANVTISWLGPADPGPVAYGRFDDPRSTPGAWTRTRSTPGWFPDNETTDPSGEVVQPGDRIGPAVAVGPGTVAVNTPESGSGAASVWYRRPDGQWTFAIDTTGTETIGLARHPTQPRRLFLIVRDIDGRHAIWTGEVDWDPAA
jgi:hypothetical protein